MPRLQRKRSSTGVYHIIKRGINKQVIFNDDEDKIKYMYRLERFKKESGFMLYGYCLMDNHVHLLLIENTMQATISEIMKKVCSSYVYWYNKKYERSGNLFEGRFKSEPVEDDKYLLTVLRYIHQNPMKAKLAYDIADYKWSSYESYFKSDTIVDTDFILGILNNNYNKAIEKYINFMYTYNEDQCLDVKWIVKVSDEDLVKIVKEHFKIKDVKRLQSFDLHKKMQCLSYLKNINGVTTRQLARVTGVPRYLILKA